VQVRCVQALRPPRSEPVEQGLTAGRNYLVLELEIGPGKAPVVRVIDDEGDPTLWMLSGFEIVDGQVPPSWHLVANEDGSFTFTPEKWARPGFWWSFFNQDYGAADDYDSELARLREFASRADRR
jgi:hypothetical protein